MNPSLPRNNRQYFSSAGLPSRGQQAGLSVAAPLHTSHGHEDSNYDIPKNTVQKSDLYLLSPKTTEDYHRFRYGLNKSPERYVTEVQTPNKYANATSNNYENRRLREYDDQRHMRFGGITPYGGKPTYHRGADSKRAASLIHGRETSEESNHKSSHRSGTIFLENHHGEFTARRGTIHDSDSDSRHTYNIRYHHRHSADPHRHHHHTQDHHYSDHPHSADYSPKSQTYQQRAADSKRTALIHGRDSSEKINDKTSHKSGTIFLENHHGDFTARTGSIYDSDSDSGHTYNIRYHRRHSADPRHHYSDRPQSADYSPNSHYHQPDYHHSGHHHHPKQHHSGHHELGYPRSRYDPRTDRERDNFERNTRAIAILTQHGTPSAYEEPEEDKYYKGVRLRGPFAVKHDYGYKGAITPYHQNRFEKHDVRTIHEHGYCKRHSIKPEIVVNPPLIEHGTHMRKNKHFVSDKANSCHKDDCCDPLADSSGMAKCKDRAADVGRRKTTEDYLRDLRVEYSEDKTLRFRRTPNSVFIQPF